MMELHVYVVIINESNNFKSANVFHETMIWLIYVI